MPAITHILIFFSSPLHLQFRTSLCLTMSRPLFKWRLEHFQEKWNPFLSKNATNARLPPPVVSTAEWGQSFRLASSGAFF
jgi:hypothetical protein